MKNDPIIIKGPNDQLIINADDVVAKKLAMLMEGTLSDIPKKEIAEKYDYSREHYYKIKNNFEESGSDALQDKKSGPKEKSKRTEVVNNQIIRLRFLDPDSSPEVIGQKLRQMGYNVSNRSVSRTIADFGLQKKTTQTKSSSGIKTTSKNSKDQTKGKRNKS